VVDQVVLPRHVVDVDLHDAHVGDGGAEVERVERGEVAVVVVGGDVQLVGLGELGDLPRLREAVPGDVHHDHVHRPGVEVGAVAAEAVEVLAGADRDGRRVLDLAEAAGS
jgi:hypothetical protein